MLVDIVSKNGNLLLNVVQRPDGSLDPEVEQMLNQLADWIAINGEGIYRTRPWLVYGEGPIRAKGGHFREDFSYSARDIRFTTKGKTLYAFALGWPGDGQLAIKSLAKPAEGGGNRISRIDAAWAQGQAPIHPNDQQPGGHPAEGKSQRHRLRPEDHRAAISKRCSLRKANECSRFQLPSDWGVGHGEPVARPGGHHPVAHAADCGREQRGTADRFDGPAAWPALQVRTFRWTVTEGLRASEPRSAAGFSPQVARDSQLHQDLRVHSVFMLLDFHPYLQDSVHVRFLKDIALGYGKHFSTVMLVGATLQVPAELRPFTAHFRLPLPKREELRAIVYDVAGIGGRARRAQGRDDQQGHRPARAQLVGPDGDRRPAPGPQGHQ